jgi:hypothetical protein
MTALTDLNRDALALTVAVAEADTEAMTAILGQYVDDTRALIELAIELARLASVGWAGLIEFGSEHTVPGDQMTGEVTRVLRFLLTQPDPPEGGNDPERSS